MDYLAKYSLDPHACKTVKEGDRFGRIQILAVGKLPGRAYKYVAVYRCDCGAERAVMMKSIQSGETKSCGCYNREKSTVHGLWHSPLMKTWRAMMSRCYDPSIAKFSDYGARGITVCERWHSVTNFHADMHATYEPGLTLERINNNGNYEPANCRWATPAEQSKNKRNNIHVSINGETLILKDWARRFGINYHTVYHRVTKMGWPPEVALTTPSTRPRRAA